MTTCSTLSLERLVEQIPMRYPGPGGAIAIIKDSRVLVRHSWGYANVEQRVPFTPSSLFRICSITKQFTCSVLLQAFADPSVLDDDLRALLPNLVGRCPSTLHLCHNQSGLRDYWALAMLQGAPVEGVFSDQDATQLFTDTRSLQFHPGAKYSYSNGNFRLISNLLENRLGSNFGVLVREKIFSRVGMETAFLASDTSAMPDSTEGYEGDPTSGFRPALNRIVWTGDAGIGASLDDLIAWELYFDRNRDVAGSSPARLLEPVVFADGRPAIYGFGLRRAIERGRLFTGHAGGLRGWRSQRLYLPEDRLSVVVLFNHMADATAAAMDLAWAALGEPDPPKKDSGAKTPAWLGSYVDPQTGLLARIEATPAGKIKLRYGQSAEMLDPDETSARNGSTQLAFTQDGLKMARLVENVETTLALCEGPAKPDIQGRFRCDELGSELEIANAGGTLYGAFSGKLGRGQMEQLSPIGPDVWALPCQRALDFAPPGDWTLLVQRDDSGAPRQLVVGCWLARNLQYEKISVL